MKLGKKAAKRAAVTAMLATVAFGGYHQASASEISSASKGNQQLSGSVKVDPSTMEIGPVLTFDEVVAEIAKSSNISIKEASDQVISTFEGNNTNSQARTLGISSTDTSNAEASALSATYRTLSSSFIVTSSYIPTLNFYCQTTESTGSFRGILKILNVNMNRSYAGISKQFGGSVYTNLEDANRIYWIVDGDFYNNGTTTVGGGVNIGVGQSASVNFSISGSSNFYKYAYKTGYRNF